MAIIISARTGGARAVAPAEGASFKLKELQDIVGGYIEAVPLPSGNYLVCNEDGKRLELPANMRATLILREAGGMPDDIVVGDVLIASPEELDGEN